MKRKHFFASLLASIAGMIGLSSTSNSSRVLGSREEGEWLSKPNTSLLEQKRYEKDWNKIHSYCGSISGIDSDGLLNDGVSDDKWGIKDIKGMLFYYNLVEKDGKRATEVVYLKPISWGTIIGGSSKWRDIKK